MQARVFELQIDDWNEGKFAAHGVTAREVRQVLDNEPIFLPNKRGHAAPIVMIGPTFGNRTLMVPLAEIDARDGVWRPVTAFDAGNEIQARYRSIKGHKQ